MITIARGDLLAAEVDALVNTVNCVGVMGKGIALQFKRKFPDMFKAYAKACKAGEVQTGTMFVVPTHALQGPQWIINFPTKQHWRSPSKIEYVTQGLVDLHRVLRELGITSIALPPLGSGNGGLDWNDVEPLIREALSDLDSVDIKLYAPSDAVRAIAPRAGLRMTWGRAMLLQLVTQYVAKRQALEPWEDASGASHLEIQKLMYFASHYEPKLDLGYAPGRYGPYSERVRHLVQEMEGNFLEGFGDGANPVLALNPIAPTTAGCEKANAYLATHATTEQETINKVLQLIEGFESPYGTELLASTHWS